MILSWNSFIEQQILEKKEIKSTSFLSVSISEIYFLNFLMKMGLEFFSCYIDKMQHI